MKPNGRPIVGRGVGQRIPALGEVVRVKGKEYGVIGVASAQNFGVCLIAVAHQEVAMMFAIPLHLLEYQPDEQVWKANVKESKIISDIRDIFS